MGSETRGQFVRITQGESKMKRWRGTLVVSYTQEIEVNADTQAEAEGLMRDAFDPTRCYNTAECQAYDVEEMEETK
jgi:hypothetical protein